MKKRLSIFEFISTNKMEDIISEIIKDSNIMEAIGRASTFSPAVAEAEAFKIIGNIKNLINTNPTPSWENVIQPLFIKLNELSTKAPNVIPNLNTLKQELAQKYPEYFQDSEELLNHLKLNDVNINTASQVIPVDPSIPTTEVPHTSSFVRGR